MTRADKLAEIEWLAGTDHIDSIARRLGYSQTGSMLAWLTKLGRQDLINRLRGTNS